MSKSITVKRKKLGRPATGTDPIVGVRMPPDLRGNIEGWAAEQKDHPSLSEAIRRLTWAALTASTGVQGVKLPKGKRK